MSTSQYQTFNPGNSPTPGRRDGELLQQESADRPALLQRPETRPDTDFQPLKGESLLINFPNLCFIAIDQTLLTLGKFYLSLSSKYHLPVTKTLNAVYFSPKADTLNGPPWPRPSDKLPLIARTSRRTRAGHMPAATSTVASWRIWRSTTTRKLWRVSVFRRRTSS